jgi:hypothetical protein
VSSPSICDVVTHYRGKPPYRTAARARVRHRISAAHQAPRLHTRGVADPPAGLTRSVAALGAAEVSVTVWSWRCEGGDDGWVTELSGRSSGSPWSSMVA